MAVENEVKLVAIAQGDLAGLWPPAGGNGSTAGAIALWTRQVRTSNFNIPVYFPPESALAECLRVGGSDFEKQAGPRGGGARWG
jgi:hypothetical protein